MSLKITCGIPTKGRYDVLDKALLSIAFQTLKPLEVIIVDDTQYPTDLREIPHYLYIFKLFDQYGINWRVLYGKKQGQHHSHEMIQREAKGNMVFRMDDDCVAEPDCLEKLASCITDEVGAVAPLVLMPNPTPPPPGLRNDINDLSKPNIQWFIWKGIKEADHLYSCFLYRKMVVPYDLTLSNKAHREETIFSHSLKRTGYKLLVNGDARVWHFRSEGGGIRSDNNVGDYNHDEQIFQGYLAKWGVNKENKKTIVLDNGLGDHYAFKHILPQLKAQGKKIVIAACFPDVFWDEPDVETISIAEAKLMFGNLDNFNIYKYLWDSNREMHIVQAFKEMYGV